MTYDPEEDEVFACVAKANEPIIIGRRLAEFERGDECRFYYSCINKH
jgi:hypothetical protein